MKKRKIPNSIHTLSLFKGSAALPFLGLVATATEPPLCSCCSSAASIATSSIVATAETTNDFDRRPLSHTLWRWRSNGERDKLRAAVEKKWFFLVGFRNAREGDAAEGRWRSWRRGGGVRVKAVDAIVEAIKVSLCDDSI